MSPKLKCCMYADNMDKTEKNDLTDKNDGFMFQECLIVPTKVVID